MTDLTDRARQGATGRHLIPKQGAMGSAQLLPDHDCMYPKESFTNETKQKKYIGKRWQLA